MSGFADFAWRFFFRLIVGNVDFLTFLLLLLLLYVFVVVVVVVVVREGGGDPLALA